ncbi:hypothetical protein BY996DRAFT_6429177 [Phakopsora pachyrhizi]|nr:hypothetical protein BY996DRAFT_6429177 [Phakopsora pachyrhizi]
MSNLPPYAVRLDKSPLPLLSDKPIDLNNQSVEVPGSRKAGQTGHYRNGAYPNFTTVESSGLNLPRTEYEVFNHGLGRSYDKPCLGHRPINPITGELENFLVWQTYKQVDQRRTDLGSGLINLQSQGILGPDVRRTGWTVGIWTHNRPEWQIVYHSCAAYSLVIVSLYETLGPKIVEYCINHAEARVIFASASHIPHLLANSSSYSVLKVIVSVDKWSDLQPIKPKIISAGDQENALKAWGDQVGIKVFDIEELEGLGRKHPIAHIPPSPSDMISICYTSGTTGLPKGAILLHRSMAAACAANLHNLEFLEEDVGLSYLPLSHIYARMFESLVLCAGISLAFSCGDMLKLLEDFKIAKPTSLIGVPRVLNRIYQAVNTQFSAPGLKPALARRALASKLERLKTTGSNTHLIWDRLVFKKVKEALGGRLRILTSGSAPIAPEVIDFFKVAFVTSVVEGYGSTENCGTCTLCSRDDPDPQGTTGPPQVGQEIKLVDVPEMNYFSTDKPYPRGEICIRGDSCIPGYYKDEDKTKELIDSEGWQHSGDIGLVDSKGRIKIIDRIKNLLKLSQGEYVALEKVEGVYAVNSLISQVYVHGDSLRSHLIGVIVPEPVLFQEFANKATGRKVSLEEACQDPKVIEAFLKDLEKTAKAGKLNGFERIKQIHLTMEAFSSENELLTPTLKLKRPAAKSKYQDICNKLYDEYDSKQKNIYKL